MGTAGRSGGLTAGTALITGRSGRAGVLKNGTAGRGGVLTMGTAGDSGALGSGAAGSAVGGGAFTTGTVGGALSTGGLAFAGALQNGHAGARSEMRLPQEGQETSMAKASHCCGIFARSAFSLPAARDASRGSNQEASPGLSGGADQLSLAAIASITLASIALREPAAAPARCPTWVRSSLATRASFAPALSLVWALSSMAESVAT